MAPLNPQTGHLGLILPLCTSSATVGLSLFQYPLFLSFLQSQPSLAGKPFSHFWKTFLVPGTSVIVANVAVSTISGLLSARWLRTHRTLETTDVSKWYVYGACLAAGHLLFIPAIAYPIKNIIDGGQEGVVGMQGKGSMEEANRKEQKTWFLWHTVRTVLVDVPALWCFAEGLALSTWIVN